MQRRLFIKATAALSSLVFFNSYGSIAKNEQTSILRGPLSGNLFYTKYKPGIWKNKVAGHLPNMKIKKNILEISTGHEMRGFEHYILKHSVFNENFTLISEKYFDPSKNVPFSVHDISGSKNIVFALSLCNKHGSWLNAIEF